MTMDFSSNYVPYHVELNNMIASHNGNGILNGLEITAQSTPSLMVDYSAGRCIIDNELYEESSSYITLSAGHSTYSRIDMVYYNTAINGISVVNGIASSDPVPPDIPDDDLLLALVNVPANDTTIETSQITDERIIIKHVSLILGVSDTLKNSNDSEEYFGYNYYYLIKEFSDLPPDLFSNDSELRIKFDLKVVNSGPATTGYGRIYRNGVAVGTGQSTTSTSYVTKSEDISGWSAGDTIELYAKKNSMGYRVYVQNFRVYGDFEAKSVIDW